MPVCFKKRLKHSCSLSSQYVLETYAILFSLYFSFLYVLFLFLYIYFYVFVCYLCSRNLFIFSKFLLSFLSIHVHTFVFVLYLCIRNLDKFVLFQCFLTYLFLFLCILIRFLFFFYVSRTLTHCICRFWSHTATYWWLLSRQIFSNFPKACANVLLDNRNFF